jgi:tRNA pseudouridine55 synthase
LNGVILLDKPAGRTSFQYLGELKRRLATGRVGHTGTLDKFAEGLLVVLSGAMTRLCPFATAMDKEYVATVRFGRGTDTLDPEGSETGRGPVPGRGQLEAVLPAFRGVISQVPPIFSAVHVEGRRAYQAARDGQTVELAPRTVSVNELDLLDYSEDQAVLRVSCSKGTYIRALARDIAERLGTFAYVSALRRTRVGGFRVEEAVAPDSFDPVRHVLPPTVFFGEATGLRKRQVRAQSVESMRHGVPFTPQFLEDEIPPEDLFGAFAPDGNLLAVVERSGPRWRYAAVFTRDEQA